MIRTMVKTTAAAELTSQPSFSLQQQQEHCHRFILDLGESHAH
jgi:hypothetical protein